MFAAIALALALGLATGAVPVRMFTGMILRPAGYVLWFSGLAMEPVGFVLFALLALLTGIVAAGHKSAGRHFWALIWGVPAAVLAFCCILSAALRFV
jgi:hypothetical protein